MCIKGGDLLCGRKHYSTGWRKTISTCVEEPKEGDSVMSKPIFVLAATLVLAGIAMLPTVSATGEDDKDREDTLVCYTWDIFPNSPLKLNVKKHSPLSERKEEREFGHAKQTAFSVHGKGVSPCGGDSMAALDGTVITAQPTSQTTGQYGAHMGVEVHVSRVNDSCRSYTIDCTTTEVSETPKTWSCFSRNEFDGFHGASTLTKVDESKDPRCSIFEDGFGAYGTAETTATDATGPAPGLRQ
jgi:hypothetical protein